MTANVSLVINGTPATKSVTRQTFATGNTAPQTDYTDLWWNERESGWGVALTQQYGTLFAAWYTYDASGKAIWYIASNCPIIGTGCTGELFQVTNGTPLTVAWNGTRLATTKVGTITFAFSDAGNATMSYTINGASATRAITRIPF